MFSVRTSRLVNFIAYYLTCAFLEDLPQYRSFHSTVLNKQL